MEGAQNQEVQLGRDPLSQTVLHGGLVGPEVARLHRDLALGNLFVELQRLVRVGIELVRQEVSS